MPTEIDVYIEHVISLSKDYSILFDKYIKLEEKCRILEGVTEDGYELLSW